MSLTVTGRISDDGKTFDHQKRVEFRAWMVKHAGKIATMDFAEKRKPRSHDQLEWLFGVAYPEIAKAAGYDAHEWKDKATLENIHEGLLQRRYGFVVDKVTGTAHAKERTTGKSALDISEYMQWVTRFAAQEYRLVLELPDERGQLTAAGGR